MDDVRAMLARVDENVKLLRKDVAPLAIIVQKNSLDIALIKNDAKWQKNIFSVCIGFFGALLGAAAEYFRK